jgi:hypothetical protein
MSGLNQYRCLGDCKRTFYIPRLEDWIFRVQACPWCQSVVEPTGVEVEIAQPDAVDFRGKNPSDFMFGNRGDLEIT